MIKRKIKKKGLCVKVYSCFRCVDDKTSRHLVKSHQKFQGLLDRSTKGRLTIKGEWIMWVGCNIEVAEGGTVEKLVGYIRHK